MMKTSLMRKRQKRGSAKKVMPKGYDEADRAKVVKKNGLYGIDQKF